MQYLEFEQPIADLEKKIQELEQLSSSSDGVLSKEVDSLKKKVESLQKNIFETSQTLNIIVISVISTKISDFQYRFDPKIIIYSVMKIIKILIYSYF